MDPRPDALSGYSGGLPPLNRVFDAGCPQVGIADTIHTADLVAFMSEGRSPPRGTVHAHRVAENISAKNHGYDHIGDMRSSAPYPRAHRTFRRKVVDSARARE